MFTRRHYIFLAEIMAGIVIDAEKHYPKVGPRYMVNRFAEALEREAKGSFDKTLFLHNVFNPEDQKTSS